MSKKMAGLSVVQEYSAQQVQAAVRRQLALRRAPMGRTLPGYEKPVPQDSPTAVITDDGTAGEP